MVYLCAIAYFYLIPLFCFMCELRIVLVYFYVFCVYQCSVVLLLLHCRHWILVNRGWVPKDKTDPATRPQGQIGEEVTLTAVVRKTEKVRIFVLLFVGICVCVCLSQMVP